MNRERESDPDFLLVTGGRAQVKVYLRELAVAGQDEMDEPADAGAISDAIREGAQCR